MAARDGHQPTRPKGQLAQLDLLILDELDYVRQQVGIGVAVRRNQSGVRSDRRDRHDEPTVRAID